MWRLRHGLGGAHRLAPCPAPARRTRHAAAGQRPEGRFGAPRRLRLFDAPGGAEARRGEILLTFAASV